MSQHNGGVSSAAGDVTVAYNAGSAGRYELSAGGLSITAGGVYVGRTGEGAFIHSGGTHTLQANLFVGASAAGVGSYALSGGSLASGGAQYIGSSGQGAFIQTGGSNTAGSSTPRSLTVAYLAGSSGRYELWSGSVSAGTVSIGGGPATFVHGLADLTASTSFTLGAQAVYDYADAGYLHTPTLTQLAGSVYRHIPAPALPANFSAAFISGDELGLAWDDVPGNHAGGTAYASYLIEHSTDAGQTWSTLATVAGSATQHTVPGPFAAGEEHQFRLSAFDAFGRSTGILAASHTFSCGSYVSTAQIVTCPAPADVMLTGQSGLPRYGNKRFSERRICVAAGRTGL